MTPTSEAAILGRVPKLSDVPSAASGKRRSPGRPPIPRERIVATALRIVDEQGSEALSLRTLALRLESSTATLYRHFSNRAELVAELIDLVLGNAAATAIQAVDLEWDQACRAMAMSTFGALRQHPNLAPLLAERVPLGPNAMAGREIALQVLLDAGFQPPVALRTYTTLARYVLGFAIQAGGAEDNDQRRVADAFHNANAVDFPATVKIADFAPVPLDDEFTFGLDLIIDGLTGVREADRWLSRKRKG